jgi:hypothetical protein
VSLEDVDAALVKASEALKEPIWEEMHEGVEVLFTCTRLSDVDGRTLRHRDRVFFFQE